MLWKWKLARDLNEVLHLLNGETKYDRPVPDARVCMTWRGDHPQFWVFATKAGKAMAPPEELGGWAWRPATDADDVLRFLRGDHPGAGPVAQAQIAAVWTGRDHQFYIFYRNAVADEQAAMRADDWGWKLATDKDDALLFLNGGGASPEPVTAARIATAHRDHHDDLFIFYQRAVDVRPAGSWRWQAIGSANGVQAAVDRKGHPPMDFQVAAPPAGHGTFQLFTNHGEGVPGQQIDLAGQRLVRS